MTIELYDPANALAKLRASPIKSGGAAAAIPTIARQLQRSLDDMIAMDAGAQ